MSEDLGICLNCNKNINHLTVDMATHDTFKVAIPYFWRWGEGGWWWLWWSWPNLSLWEVLWNSQKNAYWYTNKFFGINNNQRSLQRLWSIRVLILPIIPLVYYKIRVEVILNTSSSRSYSHIFFILNQKVNAFVIKNSLRFICHLKMNRYFYQNKQSFKTGSKDKRNCKPCS